MAFPVVFGGLTLLNPEVGEERVDQALNFLAGIRMDTGLGSLFDRTDWLRIQPYVLESVLLWERARVAARRSIEGSSRAIHKIYMLRRGVDLLHSPNPVGLLSEFLR